MKMSEIIKKPLVVGKASIFNPELQVCELSILKEKLNFLKSEIGVVNQPNKSLLRDELLHLINNMFWNLKL